MSRVRPARSFLSLDRVVAAIAAAMLLALPRAATAQAAVTSSGVAPHAEPGRVLVHLRKVSLTSPSVATPSIVVYADGPARVASRGDSLRVLTDTLRLDRMGSLVLDVTDADVHIRLLTPGEIEVEGPVTGAKSADRLGAGGRHIVFTKGGNEVKVLKE